MGCTPGAGPANVSTTTRDAAKALVQDDGTPGLASQAYCLTASYRPKYAGLSGLSQNMFALIGGLLAASLVRSGTMAHLSGITVAVNVDAVRCGSNALVGEEEHDETK